MKVITGDAVQAGTGKVVSYVVDYGFRGSTASWGAEIRLPNGKYFRLQGGAIANVTDPLIGEAVTLALNAEIDSLDLDALYRQFGSD